MITGMTASLFDLLDVDHDGSVSRSDLHAAAARLDWHWREAPVLAVLDLLTIHNPISRKIFTSIIQEIYDDPLGPYGRVLLNAPNFSQKPQEPIKLASARNTSSVDSDMPDIKQKFGDDPKSGDLAEAIEKLSGKETAADFLKWLNALPSHSAGIGNTALLIIDPQRSFTEGVWKQSIGDEGAIDVKPISMAFQNCCDILRYLYGRMEIMFSRCPFPPGSYDWDDRIANIIDSRQDYFIKPGNSILFPPYNGFREWMNSCIEKGTHTLVIGGCTLNSCVRVSSIEVQQMFENKHLQVVVDLNICGARLRNYIPSSAYSGLSAVASAVSQMTAAGVRTARRVKWD